MDQTLTGSMLSASLDDRYTIEDGRIYLSGIQALLRVLIDQRRADLRGGLNTAGFVSGYPGSPVGGVDGEMIRNRSLLEAHHIVHRPGLNEELAATAVFGTQTLHAVPGAKYDGVFGLWYGKAPGVDRSADAFHHANFRGVGRNGGVLAVAGDDPHARSTIFPSDSNTIFASFYMPVLAPGNIQDVIDFGLHGYALSRAAGLWVGFKLVTDVADAAASATVGRDRVRPVLPQVEFDGAPLVPALRVNEAGPPLLAAERQLYYGQLEIARQYARLNGLNRIVVNPPAARIGILTGGKTYFDLRQALLDLGIDDRALHDRGIRILKMGMLFPVEPTIIDEFSRGLEEIIVVEDKRPFLELFLKDMLYARPDRPRVIGKKDERGDNFLPADGELSADVIAKALARRLGSGGTTIDRRLALLSKPVIPAPVAAPSRTPYFCSGCPHNRSLQVPEGSVVGAGIGCHIMALWMGPVFGEVTGYTQMGGEGAQWVGLAPFTKTRHFYQNLGDGTFAHSGSLAIRFAIAAGANVTYKILYNSAVAMTGGQDVTGGMSVDAMVRALEAEGVKRIIVTTDEPDRYRGGKVSDAEVWHRDRLVDAERLLASVPGVTVLLNDQQCAAEKRRLRKRGKMAYRPKTVFINERVCEGCGDCGHKSNCLSVQPVDTEFGRKTQIHQSSCNQDYSCLLGDCPSFVTVEAAVAEPKPAKRAAVPFPQDVTLTEPQPAVPAAAFSMALVGIGGTGVVTVNQVLGMAAFLDGKSIQTYDHTGSSQKAGPVVSHLKILGPQQEGAPTLSRGSADLYLIFDLLGGVAANNLVLASPERTVAVVSDTRVPTGEMVSDASKKFPSVALLEERINQVTRKEHNLFLDAQRRAERLLGDHMASNLLLVGAAYQLGLIPIAAAAIEAAIRLNGTAVDANIAAFRWGRLQALDPARVDAAMADQARPEKAGPELEPEAWRLVELIGGNDEVSRVAGTRIVELMRFQNVAYARRYADFMRKVVERERAQAPGRHEFSVAVARFLYKLMAYKDEYEVARLLLDQSAEAAISGTFGRDARVSWHLHPTFLRRLGVKNKVRLGPWFRPVLALLRGGKVLRGTPLDAFGYAGLRRLERDLIGYYQALVDAASQRLGSGRYDIAVELAAAPDVVRGYEDIKLAGIAAFLARTDELQRQLGIALDPGPRLSAVRAQATADDHLKTAA